jgi:hypothetical protein
VSKIWTNSGLEVLTKFYCKIAGTNSGGSMVFPQTLYTFDKASRRLLSNQSIINAMNPDKRI